MISTRSLACEVVMYHGGLLIKNLWPRGAAPFTLCLTALSLSMGCSLGVPELGDRPFVQRPSVDGLSINSPLINSPSNMILESHDATDLRGDHSQVDELWGIDAVDSSPMEPPRSALFQTTQPTSLAEKKESLALKLDPADSQQTSADGPIEQREEEIPEEPASRGAIASDGANERIKLVSSTSQGEANPDDLEVLAVVQESSASRVPPSENRASPSPSKSDTQSEKDPPSQPTAPKANAAVDLGVSVAEVSDRSRLEFVPVQEIASESLPSEDDANVASASDAVEEPPASAAVAVSDAMVPKSVETAPLVVKDFASGITLDVEQPKITVSSAEQPIGEDAAAVISIATDAAASLFTSAGPTPEVTEPSPSDAPVISPTLEEATPAMSDAQLEIKPISQINVDIKAPEGKFPENIGAEVFAKRPEYHYTSNGPMDADFGYYWQSPAFCHRALFFEQPNLERYGRNAGILQPAVSGAHFFATIPTLPYQMVYYGTRTCCYHQDYGYDCAPRESVLPRWGTAAGLAEAGAMTGLILLIP